MRVLAVAQRLQQLAAEGAPLGGGIAQRLGHPVRDGGIVDGGAGEGFLRQAPASVEVGAAVGQGLEDRGIIVGIDHHRDVAVVLGGASYHRRAAHVDVLDHRGVVGSRRDGGLEGVEVHHQEVDRQDRVRQHGGLVLRVLADGEEAAVHLGVQRLDPPVHHLGKAGEVGDLGHGQAGLGQRAVGPAGRDQCHAGPGEAAGQCHESGLVGHGEQRAADAATIRGHGELLQRLSFRGSRSENPEPVRLAFSARSKLTGSGFGFAAPE